MDAVSVAGEPDGPTPTTSACALTGPPRARKARKPLLLLTWGLAQSRGHPQKGGPEVGSEGDVRGILGR